VIGSLVTEPDDREVLKKFYRNVRPWGYWGPIARDVMADDPGLRANRLALLKRMQGLFMHAADLSRLPG